MVRVPLQHTHIRISSPLSATFSCCEMSCYENFTVVLVTLHTKATENSFLYQLCPTEMSQWVKNYAIIFNNGRSPGEQPAFHFEGAVFMKFHSMTSSCLFNRGTTFSQTVTYNNNVFLPADTQSIVQTHTFCTTLVKNVLQQRWRLNHWCQAKFLTLRHMRMHRVIFSILNTLRKLIIRAYDLVFR